jgi:hypothetical protein
VANLLDVRRALALLSLFITLAGCHDDRRGVRLSDHQRLWRGWQGRADELGRRAADLDRAWQLQRWRTLARAAPGRSEALLARTTAWITRERLLQLRRLENSPPLAAPARRRIRALRDHLLLLEIERAGARELDRYAKTLSSTIAVDDRPVRVAELGPLIASTFDRGRRRSMQRLREKALRRLDRAVRHHYRESRAAAKERGTSLFQLLERRDQRDTRRLLRRAAGLVDDTEGLFSLLWDPLIASVAGGERVALSDLAFIRQGATHQSHLAEERLVPAVVRLLELTGLTSPEGQVGFRIRPPSARGLSTACVVVDAPMDVRVVTRPGAGLRAHVQLFEAAGRAACHLRLDRAPEELGVTGPALGPRALGHLLGLVWLERGWWKRYAQLERPIDLRAVEVRGLVRLRILADLLRLRLQGLAIPLVRVVLEGGPPSTYAGIWRQGAQVPPAALFASGLSRAGLKLSLEPTESLTVVHELGSFDRLEGARHHFDLRAYVLAQMLLSHLRQRFGSEWFARRSVGPYLLKGLCSDLGTTATADELARRFGFEKGLDFEAPRRNLSGVFEGTK